MRERLTFKKVYMNDTELENVIKKSAEDIEVKDFSVRYAAICEIAGKEAAAQNAAILAEQPVTQTTAGNAVGRRGVKIAVISAICAFVIVLAAVLTVIIASFSAKTNSMSAVDGAQEYNYNGNAVTYDDSTEADSGTAVVSAIYADQSTFYTAFASANITIADFTIYDNVSYYLYYAGDNLAGGRVLFTYKNYDTEAEFYLEEYTADFAYAYQADGVYYAIYGDLPEELVQEIAESLFLL